MTDTVLTGTPTLNTMQAVFIAEGVVDATHEEQVAAWQLLHDTGLAYRLQGWFGRTAANMIADGIINA